MFTKNWYKTHSHPKGMLGKKHTKKTRLKMSLSSPHANLGRKFGIEFRNKVSIGAKKRFMNIEERKKMSERMKGFKHSKEAKIKMSIFQRNHPNNGRFKKGHKPNKASFKKGHKLWTKERIAKMVNSLKGRFSGEKHYKWNGGCFIHENRMMVMRKSHPFTNNNGYVLKSRLVMEEKIGRYLQPVEIVHHKNKNTLDDRIENLELMKNRSAHFSLHKKEYWKQWRLKRQCV